MSKVEITLKHDKSTKNTERFAEEVEYGQTAVIGTLYMQKAAFAEDGGAPESITVSIDW